MKVYFAQPVKNRSDASIMEERSWGIQALQQYYNEPITIVNTKVRQGNISDRRWVARLVAEVCDADLVYCTYTGGPSEDCEIARKCAQRCNIPICEEVRKADYRGLYFIK